MSARNEQKVQINITLPLGVRENFRIAAKLHGHSMSGLVFQFILKEIREAKEQKPEAFPDYESDRPAVAGTEIDEILYDAFDGQPINPQTLRRMIRDAKEMSRIREIVDKKGE